MVRRWILPSVVGIGLIAALACQEAPGKDTPAREPTAPLVQLPAGGALQSLAPLVEQLQGAVVNLEVEQKVELPDMSQYHPFFGPFLQPYGQDEEEGDGGRRWRLQQGQGSGFIISDDGYILTNNHVVADADEVTVRLSDERSFEAKVIGTDPRTDVALVKIESPAKLPFVRLGSSDALRVGDWVVAIGNPYGLAHTVTAGIVSAKGRVIGAGPYDDFVQTDASINPGNSGGPLFNLAGEVVGINTAIVRQGSGIGFAVPVDLVRPILDELKAEGRVARGWMGMGLQDLDEGLRAALKVPEDTKAAVVSQVYPGLPAAEAGLQAGDVVLSLDGKPINSSEELVRAVGQRRPGQQVTLSILRAGKAREVKVTLAERPDEEALAQGRYSAEDQPRGRKDEKSPQTTDRSALAKLGVRLEPGGRYGLSSPEGTLVVAEVADDSPAEGKLARGDVIVEIGGRSVKTVEEAQKAAAEAGDVVLFVVIRNQTQRLVAVPRD